MQTLIDLKPNTDKLCEFFIKMKFVICCLWNKAKQGNKSDYVKTYKKILFKEVK